MKNILTLFSGLLLASLAALHAGDAPRAATRPNIIVILVDDLGYADIPAHGGKGLSMPHLDGLTRQGVRFSNGYVTSPQCSPSRCGLLTGIYNQRFGHEHNGCQHAAFNAGAKTLAEHLKPSGYATAAFGKWHLGDNGRGGTTDTHHPTKHGFDESWGYSDYSAASKADMQGFPVPLRPANAYHAQNFATRAAGFIEAHASQPWFIYLALHEPHVQVIPTPESDSLTKAAAPDDPLRQKCLGALHDLDAGIGLVLAKLRELKLEEQTLIVFLSDNGAPIDLLEVARQNGRKIKTPKGDAKGKGEDEAVNGSRNEPLRGRKGLTWEGGIRVPFVMTWKGTLPAGQTYDQPVISLDIAATALAAANTKPLPGTQLDGVNLLPFLQGENKSSPHERLFWRYADRKLFAVREGKWKLVQSKTEAAQLYDLDADISERNDLSARHPDIVKRLQSAWDEWNATLKPPALDN
ncbi:MAG: sulfatase-like hydrolase/transferase [Verrucomicrobiota bacterium]